MATHNKADVKAAINRLKQKKADAHTQHDQVVESAKEDGRKLITAVEAKTKSITERSAMSLELSNAQLDQSIEDMEHFLEHLQGTSEEAESLTPSSADVHRLTPSVVDRLTIPLTLQELSIPTIKLEPPVELNEANEVERLAGSLVSYRKGDGHTEGDNNMVPNESCLINTTNGPALVEAYVISGLFLAVPGKTKTKISSDGVEHRSVCTTPDEKMIYSTTSKKTICVYTVDGNDLKLKDEVPVEGAQNLWGIRASPNTGDLAVFDTIARRITLHDKAAVLLRSIENMFKTGVPWNLDWSPSGDHLFITDIGKGDVKQSVVKLKVESAAEIVWRKPFENLPWPPWLVRHIRGRLYVTHNGAVKVTMMSADDGSILKTIPVPGIVTDMRESPHAEVEMTYYKRF